MKTSTKARTLMSVALLAGAVFLAGCEEKQDTLSFKDKDQCMTLQPSDQTKNDWEKICDDAIANALKEGEANAPRYNSGSLCESEHGAGCVERKADDGSSFFMPMIMGYMIGSMMNNGSPTYITNQSKPYYYSKKDKKYYNSTGYAVPRTYGSSKTYTSTTRAAAPKVNTVRTPASVAKTGGFGASRSAAVGGRSSSFGG